MSLQIGLGAHSLKIIQSLPQVEIAWPKGKTTNKIFLPHCILIPILRLDSSSPANVWIGLSNVQTGKQDLIILCKLRMTVKVTLGRGHYEDKKICCLF